MTDEEQRSWIGRQFSQGVIEVSRADVIKFAIATGAVDAVHFDVDAARAAGHPDLVAPLGFHHALSSHSTMLVSRHRLGPDGVPAGLIPDLPLKRAMAGETEIEFLADVHAGDTITVTQTVAGLVEKEGRSGPLILLTVAFEHVNQHGAVVVRERATRVLR